ncbi:MAG: hypothetical protein ACREC6_11665 [Hyphomicrobiaceae bacterium]
MSTLRPYIRMFLGGADLEMAAIRRLAVEVLGAPKVEDKRLAWGAKASAYEAEIRAALERGETAVLVELAYDLPPDLPRGRLVEIDHHGARAGKDAASSLRQTFDLLGLPPQRWTRELELIEANDIGHIRGLRQAGATATEIVAIRNEDRSAQGMTPDVEALSRDAVRRAVRQSRLTIVQTSAPTASAIGDFIQPEFGGPGADNLLVLMPATVSFFGMGRVVSALADVEGSWHGGALPETGFWGVAIPPGRARDALAARIETLLNESATENNRAP